MPDEAAPSEVPAAVPADKMPRHVGIIMDGNGRWARSRGLSREEGHSKGADAVRTVVRAARRMGLEALTLYAFSSQNWNRPPQEVVHLMRLLRRYLHEERAEIMDNGIRLQTIGDTHRLPDAVREPLEQLIADSADNDGMLLCLALSYGGRETIAAAARAACRAVLEGTLDVDDLDAERFGAFVPSSSLLPPLDLLVRTSGELRISNFFLWEVAYAELFFTDKQWPDFDRDALVEAFEAYASRKRRYGMLDEQVAAPNPKLVARHLTPALRQAIESAVTGTEEPASLIAAMGKLRP